MSTISKEDYLKLLEELSRDEDNPYDIETYPIPEEAWMPAESHAKEKMKIVNHSGTIDILNYKKNKIQEALYKCMSMKIGRYLLKINEYHGIPNKKGETADLKMDIAVWEMKFTTPSGAPCRMEYRMNFHKDSRFATRPWLNLFSASGMADDVPVETVVDIIKWLQVIQKIGAFL